VSGKSNRAEPSGDVAYRTIIPASLMMQDPELRDFIEHPQMTGWLAPGKHLTTYPIRKGEEFNLALLHQDDGSVDSLTPEEWADKVREDFDDFEPRVRKLLGLVQSVLKWRLLYRKPLDKWNHTSGRVTLLGDACHPMLPYGGQGGAMAIEDGAVLGNLLSRISHISQLKPLLEAYQDLRLARTVTAQETSRISQRVLQLPDGPEQRERDDNMRKAMSPVSSGNAVSQHNSSGKGEGEVLHEYDADAEVDRWWAARVGELEAIERSEP